MVSPHSWLHRQACPHNHRAVVYLHLHRNQDAGGHHPPVLRHVAPWTGHFHQDLLHPHIHRVLAPCRADSHFLSQEILVEMSAVQHLRFSTQHLPEHQKKKRSHTFRRQVRLTINYRNQNKINKNLINLIF